MNKKLMVDGKTYRYMLYHLGFNKDEDVPEPMRAAILRFDETVVPLVFKDPVHAPTAYKAQTVCQLVVGMIEAGHSPESLADVINNGTDNIKDDRGYPESLQFPIGQFD